MRPASEHSSTKIDNVFGRSTAFIVVAVAVVSVVLAGCGSQAVTKIGGSSPAGRKSAALLVAVLKAKHTTNVRSVSCSGPQVEVGYRCSVMTDKAEFLCATYRGVGGKNLSGTYCVSQKAAAAEQARRVQVVSTGLAVINADPRVGAFDAALAGEGYTIYCSVGFRMVGDKQSDDVVATLLPGDAATGSVGPVVQFDASPSGSLTFRKTDGGKSGRWATNTYSLCTADSTGIHLTGRAQNVRLTPSLSGTPSTTRSSTQPTPAQRITQTPSSIGTTAKVALPIVGCSTTHGAPSAPDGIPTYLASSRYAAVPAAAAKALVWYEGDTRNESDLLVLGPLGWACSASIGADGSWGITVSPPGTNPAIGQPPQEVSVSGEYNGPGASEACNYFASARAAGETSGGTCTPPLGAQVTRKDNHLALIVTPPSVTKTRFSDRGFVLWYPNDSNAALGAHCELPDAERSLCAAVLAEALGRLQHSLAGTMVTARTVTTTAPGMPSEAVTCQAQPYGASVRQAVGMTCTDATTVLAAIFTKGGSRDGAALAMYLAGVHDGFTCPHARLDGNVRCTSTTVDGRSFTWAYGTASDPGPTTSTGNTNSTAPASPTPPVTGNSCIDSWNAWITGAGRTRYAKAVAQADIALIAPSSTGLCILQLGQTSSLSGVQFDQSAPGQWSQAASPGGGPGGGNATVNPDGTLSIATG